MRILADYCVYSKEVGQNFIYVALYVDGMLLVGNNMDLIKEVKQYLSPKFDMKYFGAPHFILGMEIKRDIQNKRLSLSQQKYIEGILKQFNM